MRNVTSVLALLSTLCLLSLTAEAHYCDDACVPTDSQQQLAQIAYNCSYTSYYTTCVVQHLTGMHEEAEEQLETAIATIVGYHAAPNYHQWAMEHTSHTLAQVYFHLLGTIDFIEESINNPPQNPRYG